MKVLHVVPSLSLLSGGVASSVRDFCRGLAQAGVSVHLVSTLRGWDAKREGPLDGELRQAGVRLYYFPVHPWKPLGERYAFSPKLREALESLIPQSDIVHIHSVWLDTTRVSSRICLKRKIPYVISPCGLLDPYGLRRHALLKRIYGLLLERRTLAGAAAVHFTSKAERDKAFLFGACPPHAVIPCSVPLDHLPAVARGTFRRRFPEAKEPHLLLFMGRLHRKKRLDIAVEAFIQVARSRQDVRLVVAGPNEGAEPAARALLAQSGLADRATFCGFLAGDRKWEAVEDSTLFLLPSEDENFGVAALEALALGVPALLSPGVGLADQVARQGAGLRVEGPPREWARTIEALLENPGRMREMGEAGKRLVREEFSTARVASALRDFYLHVLEKKPLP